MSCVSRILSVCIPTYNRSSLLDVCLAQLCPLANKLGIEIVVSNNASTDETAAVIEKYARTCERFVALNQKTNVGPIENIFQTLRAQSSEYILLLGDSNEIVESELVKVMSLLETEKPTLLISNIDSRVKNIDNQRFVNVENLVCALGWHMTHLAATIIPASAINPYVISRYQNTLFPHMALAVEYFSTIADGSVIWNSNNLIRGLSESANKPNSWRPRALEVFGNGWVDFVISLPPCIGINTKRKCILDHGIASGLFDWKGIIALRLISGMSVSKLLRQRLILIYIMPPYIIFFSFIVSIIPKSIIQALKNCWVVFSFICSVVVIRKNKN